MKILRILFGLIGTFCLLFTIFFGNTCMSKKQKVLSQAEYKGILTLWHIDTFEGGEGSRKQFLLRVAREFEKANQGVLVSVIEHTPTAVKEQFSKGIYPDLISFGNGVEIDKAKELSYSSNFSAGAINHKQYSLPWCRGGYLLISKANENTSVDSQKLDRLIVSQGEYNLPLGALLINNLTANEIIIKSPLDAYVEFVSSKESILLGTQRDVVRLRNRGIEIKTKPLSKFCDLYQNISVLTNDKNKSQLCDKFINLLMSEKTQNQLKDISMLSVNYEIDFQNEHLNSLQIQAPEKTISSFLDENALKNLQELCSKAVKGDKNAEIKFKNLLI